MGYSYLLQEYSKLEKTERVVKTLININKLLFNIKIYGKNIRKFMKCLRDIFTVIVRI